MSVRNGSVGVGINPTVASDDVQRDVGNDR